MFQYMPRYIQWIISFTFTAFLFLAILLALNQNCRAGDLSLQDDAGKTIRLTKLPQRIVVVGRAPYIPLHLLYMFQETKTRLVGYEKKVKDDEIFLPLIDTQYQKKKILETNPGPEHIAALKPDLIITKETIAGVLDQSMSIVGIPVLHLGLETPEMFIDNLGLVGKILGNQSRSEEIRLYYQSMLAQIKKGLNGIKQDHLPKVLVLEYSDRGGSVSVRVPPGSWTQTLQIEKAGGYPVWKNNLQVKDGWQIVGFEQVAAWNPDKIFIVVWHRLNSEKVAADLKKDSKWRMLKATANKELYVIPGDIYGWDTPDPRWILGAIWLATKIHPDRFAHIDMNQEIYRFFSILYAMDRTTIDKAIMHRVKLDGYR